MGIEMLPESIRNFYEVHEWNHACAILSGDFPNEWNEIIEILEDYRLLRSDILKPGGQKSSISKKIDSQFYDKGWVEKSFETKVVIDDIPYDSPTHKIDCYKNKIAFEIEWNNKDPFYDRDLNNFRLLFELRAISVGVILTRSDELQDIFDELGKGKSYGASTTHIGKLIPRLEGRGEGGCPVLVFGIKRDIYVEDEMDEVVDDIEVSDFDDEDA